MKQEAKGQVPGIDLTFADGRTGRIWGVSGVDDSRGASFDKAAADLRDRAELDDVFNWTINIELEFVVSYAYPPLLNLISTLDKLVKEDLDGGRSAKVIWYVNPRNDSMRTIANSVKEHIEKTSEKPSGLGLKIEIKDSPVQTVRR
jgi:hypothetical protein